MPPVTQSPTARAIAPAAARPAVARPAAAAPVVARPPRFKKYDLLKLVGVFATHPGATETNVTYSAPNDSQILGNNDPKENTHIVDGWALFQAAGRVRLEGNSPLHDNVVGFAPGIRYDDVDRFWPEGHKERVVQNFTPTVKISASADGAGNIETAVFAHAYEHETDFKQQFIDPIEYYKRRGKLITVRQTVAVTTNGSWAAGIALNNSAGENQMNSNRTYALIGIRTEKACAAVAIIGPATSNVYWGGPGTVLAASKLKTDRWFIEWSRSQGIAAIPVITGVTMANHSVSVLCNEAGGNFPIELYFVRLDEEPNDRVK